MKVHIEVVVSTGGNDEDYIGQNLGMEILGRPLKRMVMTFEEEVTEEEFYKLNAISFWEKDVCSFLRFRSPNPINVHSFRVTRNIQH